MKQKLTKALMILLSCFLFLTTGCSQKSKDLINYVIEEGFSVTNPELDESGKTENSSGKNNGTVDSTHARDIRELDENADCLVKNLGGHYAYERLNSEDQELYDFIYQILATYSSEITVPSLDTEQIDRVFNCVLLDHPELFYVSGYSFTKFTVNGELNSIDFTGTYIMSEDEVNANQKSIDSVIEGIYATFPTITCDYDIAKYFYETIILNTEYKLNAENNQNICSVFLNHESVCQGYAKSMQYLLQLDGIESVLVTGQVSNGEGHAWIIAKLDGCYYHIDPTWGDASYTANGGEIVENLPEINYDYLCVSSEEIGKSHMIDEIIPYPNCSETTDNYYVKENLLFQEMDEEKLHNAFDQAYNHGHSFLTVKCESSSVYSEMVDYLLGGDNAHIFEYLKSGMSQVVYSLNDVQYSITVWLQ